MYNTKDMVEFSLSEFERGLEGLSDEDARKRLPKADGTQMNAISWTVAHIAWGWLRVTDKAKAAGIPDSAMPFRSGSDDPTPPSLEEALRLLHEAKDAIGWLATEGEGSLSRFQQDWMPKDENAGTYLMRTLLHTWFHIGEINAIRQALGHPDIPFLSPLAGRLEFHP